MRTITTVTKVYPFEELSEEGKQKALENLYDINVDHEWWDCTYEDAERIGLKITGFDIDRGQYCKGDFINSPEESAHLIEKEHGKTCETHKTATSYLKERDALVIKYSDGKTLDIVTEENECEFDFDCDELDNEFKRDLLEDYRIMLSKDYDYQTSEEAIIETINCNEYEFTSEGQIA